MRHLGRVAALSALVIFVAASCGDDKKTSTAASTTAPGPKTIGGCLIEPGANCPGANLSGANLVGVNLAGANLATANLSKSNLSNANLSGANLTDANLTGVVMIGTNLSNANLTKADFKGGNLENVNLFGATHCGTIRTDGSVDNFSCPQPSPPTSTARTSTPPTTINTSPPPCSESTLLKLVQGQPGAGSATAGGAPTCAELSAAMLVKVGTEVQVALFHVGADHDAWVLVALFPQGKLPPSIASLCPGLPPTVAGVVGCGSG